MNRLKLNNVMSKVCFYILLVAFTSCTTEVVVTEQEKQKEKEKEYEVIMLDGCEYYKGWRKMAHKGNCKNPIHKCNCN